MQNIGSSLRNREISYVWEGGDSRGKVLCFYFSIVLPLSPQCRGNTKVFVLDRQIWQCLCNENITDYRGKRQWFYQLGAPTVRALSRDLLDKNEFIRKRFIIISESCSNQNTM